MLETAEPGLQEEQFRKTLQRSALLCVPVVAFLGHSLAFRVDMPKPGRYFDIPVLTLGLGYCTFMALHHNRWRPLSRNTSVLTAIAVCLVALTLTFLRLNWIYDGWVDHE